MIFKIIPIKVGECKNPYSRVFFLEAKRRCVLLYNYIWIIEDCEKENFILVDTGFDADFAKNYMLDIKQTTEEMPLNQLKELRIRTDLIHSIIITHTHFDHLSPVIFNFPQARVYIQQIALDYVNNPPHPWFVKYVHKETVQRLTKFFMENLIVVDGDVYVDKRIRLFRTGGHTPGSQGIELKGDNNKKVILTGDVVFTYRNIKEDIPVGFNYNLEECFNAMRRIRETADIVLPSHDPRVIENQPYEI